MSDLRFADDRYSRGSQAAEEVQAEEEDSAVYSRERGMMIAIIITEESEVAKLKALGVVDRELKPKPDWVVVGHVRGYEHEYSFGRGGSRTKKRPG